jgi:peroxiredoxin
MRPLPLLLAFVALACGPGPMPPSIGHPLADSNAPAFHEMSANSGDVGLPADPLTRVTVVDFWASWCGECQRTVPMLDALWQEKRDKGVMVIGVSIDEHPEEAKAAAERLGATFPIVADSWMQVARKFGVSKIPLTFVVDGNNTVRWVGRDPAEARQAVEVVLAGR